jgi:parvulin-like peptidyl-prolyl isomerase
MRVHVGRHRIALAIGFLVLAGLATAWGRTGSSPQGTAQPAQTPPSQPAVAASNLPTSTSDYSERVVAYIYGKIPITREELGEYLIARLGTERLENMVNRRIIEEACRAKNIDVTAAEIEADFAETLKGIGPGTTAKRFEDTVLKPNHHTLYEWKEDAVRPRLLLTKLSRARVQVTEEDLQKAFEAHYGEKVDCRIIMWPPAEKNQVLRIYPTIRDSEQEFETKAKQQANAVLAAKGGQVEPIGHHLANPEVEKVAFALKPGEVSRVLETPEGLMVIKCVKRLPPDTSKSLEKERDRLTKEVFDKKLQVEIGAVFQELRKQANPVFILKKEMTEDDLKRQVEKELSSDTGKSATPPRDN